MTTTSNARNELERIRMDIHRITRPQVCRETMEQALERAGELAMAGLWLESRTVAEQVRQMMIGEK